MTETNPEVAAPDLAALRVRRTYHSPHLYVPIIRELWRNTFTDGPSISCGLWLRKRQEASTAVEAWHTACGGLAFYHV